MEKIINEIKDCKKSILIIGDIMVDQYSFGKMDRRSSEVPANIFDISNEKFILGGAGNLFETINGFKINCDLCGVIGNDFLGQIVLSKIKDKKYIFAYNNFDTILKHRFYTNNGQVFRSDKENLSNYNVDYTDIYSKIENSVNNYDLLLISDYDKGFLKESFVKEIVKLFKDNNKLIVADSKCKNLEKFRKIDTIKLNKNEFENVSQTKFNNIGESINKIVEILNEFEIGEMLLTVGKQGLYLVYQSGEYLFSPAQKVKKTDVVGAGDCVTGTYAICKMANIRIKDNIDFLSLTAKYVVSNVGTVGFSIDKFLAPIDAHNKVKTVKEMVNISRQMKLDNETLVFTNGCFDVIHLGHLTLLSEAKLCGDKLVVALNSDDSITRLKGKDRPINSLDERIQFINFLDFVDYIIYFDEDTPEKIINQILPAVLIKGKGYNKENIVGADTVEKNGGKVISFDFDIKKSSTNIIKKLEIKDGKS